MLSQGDDKLFLNDAFLYTKVRCFFTQTIHIWLLSSVPNCKNTLLYWVLIACKVLVRWHSFLGLYCLQTFCLHCDPPDTDDNRCNFLNRRCTYFMTCSCGQPFQSRQLQVNINSAITRSLSVVGMSPLNQSASLWLNQPGKWTVCQKIILFCVHSQIPCTSYSLSYMSTPHWQFT